MPWTACRVLAAARGSGACGSACSRTRRSPAAAAPTPMRHRRLSRAELRGIKHLVHFAVDDALLVGTDGVAGDHAAPEIHRAGVAQVFADFPTPGEATQDQMRRARPDY